MLSILTALLVTENGPICDPQEAALPCVTLCQVVSMYAHCELWPPPTPFTDCDNWRLGSWVAESNPLLRVPAPCDVDALSYHRPDECQYALDWFIDHRIMEAARCHDMQCVNGVYEQMARTAQCMRAHPFWDGCFCGYPGDGC